MKNFSAGAVTALVTLSYSISYGVLVFSARDLQQHWSTGLHCALMTAWIAALVVALGSSFHFAIAGPDSNATAILAMLASTIAATMVNATPDEVVSTLWAMLTSSAIITGIIVYTLGALRCGRLVRFLPYPVIGGFLAGTGYLIIAGAYTVLTGQNILKISSEPPRLPAIGWVTAVLVALALLTLPKRIKHYLTMPAILVTGVLIFYAGMMLSGLDINQARMAKMMFSTDNFTAAKINPAYLLPHVHWRLLIEHSQDFLAMAIVVIVTILLNATGIDLATQRDVDFDRELRVNGIANLLSGVMGGMIGYLSISRSLLNFKAGAASRMAGVFTAMICMSTAFIFTPVIFYIPKPVLAGLLLFLGLSMLREWLLETFSKLPLLEYGLILVIVLLIIFQGLIGGVAFGLLVASMFFVYNYSRTNCIKHSFYSNSHCSAKERPMEQLAQLKLVGHEARTLALQGYLFFGTSTAVVDACRQEIRTGKLRLLMLDFRLVQGLDASAILGFTKLEQICSAHNVKLLLTGLHGSLEKIFLETKLLPHPFIKVFPDMDHGLEWMEDTMLGAVPRGTVLPAELRRKAGPVTMILAETDLRRSLSPHFTEPMLDILIGYCESLKFEKGAALFKRGDPGNCLYFIERGEVSVLLTLESGQIKRLRSFGPGTVVGEMGLYLKQPRSADVVTDVDCRLRKLSTESLEKMEQEHPEVAIQFHIFVVKLLSSRLAAANEEIRALL